MLPCDTSASTIWTFSKLNRIIAHNVSYLGNLALLRPGTDRFVVFMSRDRLSGLVWQGTLRQPHLSAEGESN